MLAGSSFFGEEYNTIRKYASLETVLATKPKSFSEEVAEAIYNRAGALGNSHPSVFIGKQRKIVEGLMEIAEALRQAAGNMTSDRDNFIAPAQNQVNKQETANKLENNIDSEGDFNKVTSPLYFPSGVQEQSLEVNIQRRNTYRIAHKVSSSGDVPKDVPRVDVLLTPSCPELTSEKTLQENINTTAQETCPQKESLKNDGIDMYTSDGSSRSIENYPREASTVIHLRLAIDHANSSTTFLSRPVGRSVHHRPSFGCFGDMSATRRPLSTPAFSKTRKSKSFFHLRRASVLSFLQPKFATRKSKSERKLRKGEELRPFINRTKVKNLRKQIRNSLSEGRKSLRNAFSRLRCNLITAFKS